MEVLRLLRDFDSISGDLSSSFADVTETAEFRLLFAALSDARAEFTSILWVWPSAMEMDNREVPLDRGSKSSRDISGVLTQLLGKR